MGLKRSLAALSITLFLLSSTGAGAASLSFIPETPTDGLVNGDIVALQVWLDFSDVLDNDGNVVGTIGGGFSILFDPDVLAFSSLDYIQIGDPMFGGPPSINPFVPGVLEDWAVGDFEGIIGPVMAGSVSFEVIASAPFTSDVAFTNTMTLDGGLFLNGATFTLIDTDYGDITLTSVPLPAGLWLLLSSLGGLLTISRRSKTEYE